MRKIIAIEGFWRIGKTSLCKELSKKIEKVKYIQEPDHLKAEKRPRNVEYWYLKRWKGEMELAKKYKKKGYTVIMERSFISTLAFNNALGKKITGPMKKLIKYHKKNTPDITIILEVPLPFLKRLVFSKADKKILKTRTLYKQKSFFRKYIECFHKSVAHFKIKHFYVQVANDSSFYPLLSIVDTSLEKLKEKAPLQ
jgi:thymidylate kinase